MSRRLVRELLVGAVLLGVPAFVVARLADGWEDWVFYGVFVLCVLGAANALHHRQYTTKKRTFVRHYDHGPETDSAFRRIAVGTDGSPAASKAVEAAVDLAEHGNARLIVISSYEPISEGRLRREQEHAPIEVQWAMHPTSEVDEILDRAAWAARARGLQVTTVASQGDPVDVLCRFAAEHEADILVIGSRGIRRRVLGSFPISVAQKAPCSVLIVKTR
jgi:nucleotide-binding universal stress UspA family protein